MVRPGQGDGSRRGGFMLLYVTSITGPGGRGAGALGVTPAGLVRSAGGVGVEALDL